MTRPGGALLLMYYGSIFCITITLNNIMGVPWYQNFGGFLLSHFNAAIFDNNIIIMREP